MWKTDPSSKPDLERLRDYAAVGDIIKFGCH